MLPSYLYRGDSDPKRARKLKEIWGDGFLITNLGNGGCGEEVFRSPLSDLIRRHIDVGWDKTHFLSFSTSHETAMRFAGGGRRLRVAPDRKTWHALVLSLDTSLVRVERQPFIGGYQCVYAGRKRQGDSHDEIRNLMRYWANEGIEGTPTRALLLDVRTYLTGLHDSRFNVAIAKADADREWLVLPLDPFTESPGGFTSKLDDACLTAQRYMFDD